ncbi:hypothetical protein M911_10285 [Ectothiorhodospira haloalkaliphila]|uniref:Uncharacterized protein n=1 Tax=Ectothiorhodospira haloalkaliphila TaxID=421628 RepID=W8KUP6_9GAMM|nr:MULTISPECIES: hypothetical protein [Ectothiorhodospira]AHK80717.1 hypothetical protein M911_10285 [Ectothiorhodospira haloalkaliphila]MCG5498234.1 hypothetical protein [Ectothiorhodospira variabilis]
MPPVKKPSSSDYPRPARRPWLRSRQPTYRIAAVGVGLLMVAGLGIYIGVGYLGGVPRQLVLLFSAPGIPMGWWFLTMSTWNAGPINSLIIQGATGACLMTLGILMLFGAYGGIFLVSLGLMLLACFHFYLAVRSFRRRL